MKAIYNAEVSNFKKHKDVHVISAHADTENAHYPKEEQDKFEHHMGEATRHFNEAPHDFDEKTKPHTEHLKTYINKTVREGTKPSVEGFKSHLKDHFMKKVSSVKTAAAAKRHEDDMNKHVSHVDQHNEHFNSVLNMHHHLQKAKDVIVKALSSKTEFEHHIAGQKVKPEGFVVSRNNRPTKLNDRDEFNKMNFLARSK